MLFKCLECENINNLYDTITTLKFKGVLTMPNHITSIIKAPQRVIESILNHEKEVDFNLIDKWTGFFPYSGIPLNVEGAAKSIVEKFSNLTLENYLQKVDSCKETIKDVKGMKDEDLSMLKVMVKNYIETGYFHNMDFARGAWGTKWNAYDCRVIDENSVAFDTAWCTPYEAMVKLSVKFPESTIEVNYADENLGHNCGTYVLKNGELLKEITSNDLNENDKNGALKFACEVKGYDFDEYLREIKENEDD